MIERIYITQLRKMLNCKDVRTVTKFCDKNEVGILSDNGSNKKYVIYAEFEAKYLSAIFKYIQRKYHRELPESLNEQMKFFAEYTKVKEEKTNKYVPKSRHELQFLASLQSV